MTKILLMRHAKAVPAAAGTSDFDRPLEDSGQADAALMGRLLAARWGTPERIICSGAKRTRETLAALGLTADTLFSDPLYQGEADDYIAALAGESAGSILLIGHNPSVHGAAVALAGSGDPADRSALSKAFPTAGLAALEFDGPLAELRAGQCRLEAFLTPADAAPG